MLYNEVLLTHLGRVELRTIEVAQQPLVAERLAVVLRAKLFELGLDCELQEVEGPMLRPAPHTMHVVPLSALNACTYEKACIV